MGAVVDIMTILLLFILFCWIGTIEKKIDLIADDVIDLMDDSE